MRRYSYWGVAFLLALILSGCSGSPVAAPSQLALSRLTVHIDLASSQTVAGHSIDGALVVYNPGDAMNLALQESRRCPLLFDVILRRGTFHVEAGLLTACSTQVLVLAHGTTRLRFTLNTRYNQCPTGYNCFSDGKLLGFPPLPPGSYEAATYWFTKVRLPKSSQVTVALT